MSGGYHLIKDEVIEILLSHEGQAARMFLYILRIRQFYDSPVGLKKNQAWIGCRSIKSKLKITQNRYYEALNFLVENKFITKEVDHKGTLLTINEWVFWVNKEEKDQKLGVPPSDTPTCIKDGGVPPSDTGCTSYEVRGVPPSDTILLLNINNKRQETKNGSALFDQSKIQEYSTNEIIDLCRLVFRESRAILNDKDIGQYPLAIPFDDASYKRALDMLDKYGLPKVALIKAIYGARFETPGPTFNPAKEFNPRRFERKENIQKFVGKYDDYLAAVTQAPTIVSTPFISLDE